MPQVLCYLITEGNLCPVLVSLTNKHTHKKSINTQHNACIPRNEAAGMQAEIVPSRYQWMFSSCVTGVINMFMLFV